MDAVNPFSEGSWLWRAWRGSSLTFATLFALSMLGVSAIGWFRHWLRDLGAPWYCLILFPMVLIAVLSRKEKEWLPDPEQRRRFARWLVLGSIAVVVLVAKLGPEKKAEEKAASEPVGRAGIRR